MFSKRKLHILRILEHRKLIRRSYFEEIVINAQHEFKLFKKKKLALSKDAILKHAQQLIIYEYLLSRIENTDWLFIMAYSPLDYQRLANSHSLLQDLYYKMLSEKTNPFNSSIYWHLIMEF